MRILVVEDEKALNELMVKTLKLAHYGVDSCLDGKEALSYIEATDYDAILLDLMIPGIDGLSLLAQMRQQGIKTPVLILSAKDRIEDRVRGLDLGADDYLTKPFAFDELLARLRVITRRQINQVSNQFQIGDLCVDSEKHLVHRGEKAIELSSKEFAILDYMIRHQGIVLSRNKIEEHVWDYGFEGGSNVVDVYIRYLRKKIDQGHDIKLIHTIRGSGYVLREER